MRFAVDESTGKKFDAIYIGDIFKSATDEIVLSFAEREKRILRGCSEIKLINFIY